MSNNNNNNNQNLADVIVMGVDLISGVSVDELNSLDYDTLKTMKENMN